MFTKIKLTTEFVSEAKIYANDNYRSVEEQIEYWSGIGRVMEENPDLSFQCVQQILSAIRESREPSKLSEYKFTEK